MPEYKIPDEVKLKFDPNMSSGLLTNFFYRIIWVAISIGHIRDQYFSRDVHDFVYELEKRWPLRPAEFILFARASALVASGYGCYYTKKGATISAGMRKIDINWWVQVWERLYYKKDIKLIFEADFDKKSNNDKPVGCTHGGHGGRLLSE